MVLSLTCHYQQRYLPTKRHKKERIRTMVTGGVEISVKELNKEDFPVAMIVHDHHTVYPGVKSNSEFGGKNNKYIEVAEEYRWHNGQFYKPIRYSYGAAISTEFVDTSYLLHELKSDWKLGQFECNYLADLPFNEQSIVIGDNLDIVKSILQEKADQYILCDNKVWEECGEPRYMINTFGLGHNHGGTGFFIEDFYNPNIPAKNYFNALEYDRAVAYGKAVAAGRGDDQSVDSIGMFCHIDVLMSETVTVNPQKDHADGGDPFMETLEVLISKSDSATEAGILTMATTFAEIAAR